MELRQGELTNPHVQRLLQEHLESMPLYSPKESIHALDLQALCAPDITFWTAWEGDELMGCGALREIEPGHGEIKSMRTALSHRNKGVAATLVRHILEEAGRRSYHRLSLETGAHEAFAPARSLYARFGFEPCGPFAGYVEDPFSVFMTRQV